MDDDVFLVGASYRMGARRVRFLSEVRQVGELAMVAWKLR